MNKPSSVSVIMSNYNHGRYIAAALESVCTQQPQPKEVVIVDDGSTDASVDIISALIKKYPLICLLRNETNKGMMFSYQLALSKISGDYVIGFAADDMLLPGLIKKSVDMLERYPCAGFCCSDSRTIFEDTGRSCVNHRRLSREACYISPERLVARMRGRIIYLSSFGAVFRKKCLDETGLLPDLKWSGDMIYSMIAAFRYGFCYVPEVLAVNLSRKESYSAAGIRARAQHEKVMENLFELLRTPQYSDVLPKFRESCSLAALELPLLRFLAGNNKYREFLTPNLVRLVLEGEFKNLVGAYTPAAVKKVYWWMRGLAAGCDR